MFKYFFAMIFAITLIGCGNDDVAEEVPPAGAQQQQPGAQPQQPGAEGMPFDAPEPDTDISDEELSLFIDAAMNAQHIQMEAQQEMMAIVQEEGIEVETFNEIMQAQQMGQTPEELDVTTDEMESFEQAAGRIQEVEAGMMDQLAEAVEEEGMAMERFQEINMAIQQDPGLQQQLQMMMQEQMPAQPQQPPPPQ